MLRLEIHLLLGNLIRQLKLWRQPRQLKQDIVSVELENARKGRPSPLGEAMLAYERKWGERYDPVTDQ